MRSLILLLKVWKIFGDFYILHNNIIYLYNINKWLLSLKISHCDISWRNTLMFPWLHSLRQDAESQGKSPGNDPGWHWANNVQENQTLWLYYQLDTLRCLYASSDLEFFHLQFNLSDTFPLNVPANSWTLHFIKLNFTLRGHTCRALKRSQAMPCSNLTFINSHDINCCLKPV